MKNTLILYISAFAAIVYTVGSLSCYRCHSTQPGCGKELNIRLQERKSCPSVGRDGGENFCVKIIHNKDGEKHITRECMMTLLDHTAHRQAMPTVRRHGYCEPARNDDPLMPVDENKKYCFCNDWNGCNSAPSMMRGTLSWTSALVMGIVSLMAARWGAGL